MRQAIALYESFVHQLPVGISVWSLENPEDPSTFRLVFANSAIEEFSGSPVETLYGKTIAELFPKTVGSRWPQILQEVLVSGEAKEFAELPYDEQASRDRAFWVKVCPLPNQCVGVAFEDLTRRDAAATIIS